MELRINDENLFWYLDQLGYKKVKTGRWIEELVDDGQIEEWFVQHSEAASKL